MSFVFDDASVSLTIFSWQLVESFLVIKQILNEKLTLPRSRFPDKFYLVIRYLKITTTFLKTVSSSFALYFLELVNDFDS